jgi:hypothetical protein
MSQTLTLELPDEIYEAVRQAAEATGKPPAEWITTNLSQLLPAREAMETRLALAKAKEEAIAQMAAKLGKTREDVAAEWRARYGSKRAPQFTEDERRAARERLRRYAGALSSGDPHSADNERIDEDLAREYGSTHEGYHSAFC